MAKLIYVAAVSVPLSIGLGFVVQEMFPFMAGNTAGMVGGAITVPALLALVAVGRDY